MFPHMVERAIIPHAQSSDDLKDNVSIINARDLKPLVSIAENVKVRSQAVCQLVVDGLHCITFTRICSDLVDLNKCYIDEGLFSR